MTDYPYINDLPQWVELINSLTLEYMFEKRLNLGSEVVQTTNHIKTFKWGFIITYQKHRAWVRIPHTLEVLGDIVDEHLSTLVDYNVFDEYFRMKGL